MGRSNRSRRAEGGPPARRYAPLPACRRRLPNSTGPSDSLGRKQVGRQPSPMAGTLHRASKHPSSYTLTDSQPCWINRSEANLQGGGRRRYVPWREHLGLVAVNSIARMDIPYRSDQPADLLGGTALSTGGSLSLGMPSRSHLDAWQGPLEQILALHLPRALRSAVVQQVFQASFCNRRAGLKPGSGCRPRVPATPSRVRTHQAQSCWRTRPESFVS